MRVIAVIPGNGEGSTFAFVRRQIKSLTNLGLDVEKFYLASRTRPRLILSEWLRLRRAINNFSPDLVHAQYGTMTGFLCVLVTSRPVAITFRGSDLNFEPGINFFRTCMGHILSQLSALRARIIFCTSPQLRNRLWWRREHAVLVPTGVDINLFSPMAKEVARRSLGWNLGDRVVLFNAGRNPRVKGLPLAIRAVETAKRIVGPIRFAQLNGEAPSEKMPVFLNAADCLVLASKSEGSPNIVKEAMACNLPVASVEVGDVAERLKDVHPSRVVARNSEALAQAIIEILTDGRRSNGREMIMECSEERIAQTIKNAYANSERKPA